MKVELKLTPEQVDFLATVINSFVDDHKSQFSTLSRREKAVYTIAADVADKLYNKSRSISRKPKSTKPVKMTFKYHEAHGVHFFVDKLKDGPCDPYFQAVAYNIYSQLDQKLA